MTPSTIALESLHDEQLRALSRVVLAVNQAPDLDAAMRAVLDETLLALDFDGGGIYTLRPGTNLARVVYHAGLPDEVVEEIREVRIDAPPYAAVFLEARPYFLENYEQLAPERAERYGFSSLASIPLTCGGTVVGALNVVSGRRHAFSDDERLVLTAIGYEMGCAINRVETQQALQDNEANFRQFFDSSQDMSFVVGPEGRVLAVNAAVERRLGYTTEECLEMTVQQFHPADRADEVVEVITAMLAGVREVCSIPVRTKYGQDVPVETRVSPGTWGGVDVVFGTVRDLRSDRLAQAATDALSAVAAIRDPYTAGHEKGVAALSARLALDLGFSADVAETIRMAGSIHDIGKVAVPADILSKPGLLSDVERAMMRTHAQVGHEILSPMEYVGPVPRIVLEHHERLDGSGYPAGLTGNDILFESRIVAVADVVEAMTSRRPYRPALGLSAAIAEIMEQRGISLDADVVDACVRLHEAGELDAIFPGTV